MVADVAVHGCAASTALGTWQGSKSWQGAGIAEVLDPIGLKKGMNKT
jgi:hypothetical protein